MTISSALAHVTPVGVPDSGSSSVKQPMSRWWSPLVPMWRRRARSSGGQIYQDGSGSGGVGAGFGGVGPGRG